MSAPLDVDGPAAPPRSNGELVFAQPWESRAFGMAVALHEAGAFTWPRFRAALIARIRAWEDEPAADKGWNYYRLWLAALEDVVTDQDLVRADEITARARTLAGRPRGHDHGEAPPVASASATRRRAAHARRRFPSSSAVPPDRMTN